MLKRAVSPVASSWGTPLCRPLTGPGVQAEVSLSVDPRSPWGSCTVEIHWPDGHPILGFQSRSEHALSSPPLAYISLGHHWPVVGQVSRVGEELQAVHQVNSRSETFAIICRASMKESTVHGSSTQSRSIKDSCVLEVLYTDNSSIHYTDYFHHPSCSSCHSRLECVQSILHYICHHSCIQ